MPAAEIERLRGNPGHRPVPDIVLVAGRGLDEPTHLDAEALEVWNELAPILTDAGIVDRGDSVMLEALCIMVARARWAGREIREHGMAVVNPRTGNLAVNPAIRAERDAWREALRYADRFGLHPVGRTKLGLALLQGRSLVQELSEL